MKSYWDQARDRQKLAGDEEYLQILKETVDKSPEVQKTLNELFLQNLLNNNIRADLGKKVEISKLNDYPHAFSQDELSKRPTRYREDLKDDYTGNFDSYGNEKTKLGFFSPNKKLLSVNVPRIKKTVKTQDSLMNRWLHENVHGYDHLASNIQLRDEEATPNPYYRSPNVLANKLYQITTPHSKYSQNFPKEVYYEHINNQRISSAPPKKKLTLLDYRRRGQIGVELEDLQQEIANLIQAPDLKLYNKTDLPVEIISHMVPNIEEKWGRGVQYNPTSPESIQKEATRKLIRNLLKDTQDIYWPSGIEDKKSTAYASHQTNMKNKNAAYKAFQDKIDSLRKENYYQNIKKDAYDVYRYNKQQNSLSQDGNLNEQFYNGDNNLWQSPSIKRKNLLPLDTDTSTSFILKKFKPDDALHLNLLDNSSDKGPLPTFTPYGGTYHSETLNPSDTPNPSNNTFGMELGYGNSQPISNQQPRNRFPSNPPSPKINNANIDEVEKFELGLKNFNNDEKQLAKGGYIGFRKPKGLRTPSIYDIINKEIARQPISYEKQYFNRLNSRRFTPNNSSYSRQQESVEPVSLLDYLQQGRSTRHNRDSSLNVDNLVKYLLR